MIKYPSKVLTELPAFVNATSRRDMKADTDIVHKNTLAYFFLSISKRRNNED